MPGREADGIDADVEAPRRPVAPGVEVAVEVDAALGTRPGASGMCVSPVAGSVAQSAAAHWSRNPASSSSRRRARSCCRGRGSDVRDRPGADRPAPRRRTQPSGRRRRGRRWCDRARRCCAKPRASGLPWRRGLRTAGRRTRKRQDRGGGGQTKTHVSAAGASMIRTGCDCTSRASSYSAPVTPATRRGSEDRCRRSCHSAAMASASTWVMTAFSCEPTPPRRETGDIADRGRCRSRR